MICLLQGAEAYALVIWGRSALSIPRAQHDSRRRLDRRPQSQKEGKQHLNIKERTALSAVQTFILLRLRESRLFHDQNISKSQIIGIYLYLTQNHFELL